MFFVELHKILSSSWKSFSKHQDSVVLGTLKYECNTCYHRLLDVMEATGEDEIESCKAAIGKVVI